MRSKTKLDWTYWTDAIAGSSRELGGVVCNALRMVYHHHQTGYGLEVMERLIPRALALQLVKIQVTKDDIVSPRMNN